jgi:long-chain acyl-CoA synthetase
MRHYKHPQLTSYDALLEQGAQLAAAEREQLQAEVERGSGQDTACLFFTAGATGPAKAVVFTYAALIDRARAAAAIDELNDADVAMAYLPPAWIGQHLVGFAQPMVVGYCTCFPESAETMLTDMREVGPTYFLAPPRVLETLLTQVTIRMSDAGSVMRLIHRRFMALAGRVGGRILSGESVSLADRFAYVIANLLIFGPLRDVLGMSRLRTAYVAGEAAGVDLLMFFRSIGINLKQLYGSTETGFFVAMQRNGEIVPGSVGRAADGVELTFTAQREILVRSRGLFKEYYGAPEATNATRNEQGWVHTGDAGFLDSSGCLRIIDRIGDVGTLNDGTLFAPRPLENRVKFSHYIKEAIAFGNRRDAVCMLIDIDIAAVGNWADKQSISYTGHADLASRSEVYGLIAECIARVNAKLALEPSLATSQIHRFLILPRQLDADDGVLTRMRTVRRDVIAARYRALVEAMYEGRAAASFEPAFSGEDGRAVALTADLLIGDAKTFAAAHVGKAA